MHFAQNISFSNEPAPFSSISQKCNSFKNDNKKIKNGASPIDLLFDGFKNVSKQISAHAFAHTHVHKYMPNGFSCFYAFWANVHTSNVIIWIFENVAHIFYLQYIESNVHMNLFWDSPPSLPSFDIRIRNSENNGTHQSGLICFRWKLKGKITHENWKRKFKQTNHIPNLKFDSIVIEIGRMKND